MEDMPKAFEDAIYALLHHRAFWRGTSGGSQTSQNAGDSDCAAATSCCLFDSPAIATSRHLSWKRSIPSELKFLVSNAALSRGFLCYLR